MRFRRRLEFTGRRYPKLRTSVAITPRLRFWTSCVSFLEYRLRPSHNMLILKVTKILELWGIQGSGVLLRPFPAAKQKRTFESGLSARASKLITALSSNRLTEQIAGVE